MEAEKSVKICLEMFKALKKSSAPSSGQISPGVSETSPWINPALTMQPGRESDERSRLEDLFASAGGS